MTQAACLNNVLICLNYLTGTILRAIPVDKVDYVSSFLRFCFYFLLFFIVYILYFVDNILGDIIYDFQFLIRLSYGMIKIQGGKNEEA